MTIGRAEKTHFNGELSLTKGWVAEHSRIALDSLMRLVRRGPCGASTVIWVDSGATYQITPARPTNDAAGGRAYLRSN